MANEFKIKKGLIVTGASGGTVVDIQGSQGQLFSVTDDLSGSIFAVSDISGVPIFDVNSSGVSYFDGTVGIGTSTPQQKLHIKSTTSGPTGIIIENTNNAQSLDLDFWSNAGSVQGRIRYNEGAGSFDISPNAGAGPAMTMLYNGNVGIGTTAPGSKLELGPNGSLGANITNKNVILNIDGGYGTTGTPSSGQYKVIGFTGTTKDVTDITGQTGGETSKNFYAGIIGGDYFNGNRFSVWQNGVERLTIVGTASGSGNVGIGDTNPGVKLDVASGTIRIKGDQPAGTYYYGFMYDGTNLQGTTQTNLIYTEGTVLANTTIAEWASLRIGNPSTSATGAVITNNYAIKQDSSAQKNYFAGNVGIGTDSPLSILTVGSSTGQSRAAIYGEAYGAAGVFDQGIRGEGSAYGVLGMSTGAGVGVYGESSSGHGGYFTSSTGYGLLVANGNVGIGTTSPNALLSLGDTAGQKLYVYESGAVRAGFGVDLSGSSRELSIFCSSSNGYSDGNISLGYRSEANGAYQERMRITSAGAIQFNAYNSTNQTGTPTYMLGTDASGNVVKTASSPGTSTATSLYDLIPNGSFTTTYAFTSTAGVYAEVMESNDVITSTGTYSVQMIVNDYAVGGTQYDEKYSGVMSWHATSTNDSGIGASSEIALHRSGHAGNAGITYLRTRETTNAETNRLKLEIMCNKTYTSASNVIFKFVKLI